MDLSRRKRRADANGNFEGTGRKAKRRIRDFSQAIDSDDGGDDPDDNPSRPLNEREIRNLYRAYARYGSLEDCWDAIMKDSKLGKRDPEVIKSTIAELIQLSKEAIEKQRPGGDISGKKEKKAILFDYKGARKLNAETIVVRPDELKALRQLVGAFKNELTKFRINDVKPVHNWSCDWGTREDSMLCVGIAKHGYGAWTAIRDDPELGMQDKFFLEEHRVDKKEARTKAEAIVKSPGAVHLVRRADYLMGVIKERVDSLNARTLNDTRRRERPGSANSPGLGPRKSKSKSVGAPSDSYLRRQRELDRERGRDRDDRDERDRDLLKKKRRREDGRYDEEDRHARDKHRRSLDGSRNPVGKRPDYHERTSSHHSDRHDRHRDDRHRDDRHRDDRHRDDRHRDDRHRDDRHRDDRHYDRSRDDRHDSKRVREHGHSRPSTSTPRVETPVIVDVSSLIHVSVHIFDSPHRENSILFSLT